MNRWWIVAALLMVGSTGLAWSAGPLPRPETDAGEQKGDDGYGAAGYAPALSAQPPEQMQPDWDDARPASQPSWVISAQVSIPPESLANLVDWFMEQEQYDQAYICCALIHHRYPERDWQAWAVRKARGILDLVWNPRSSTAYRPRPRFGIWDYTPPVNANIWEPYSGVSRFFRDLTRHCPGVVLFDAGHFSPACLDPVRVLSAADTLVWKPPFLVVGIAGDESLAVCELAICIDRVAFDTWNPEQVSGTVLVRCDVQAVIPPIDHQPRFGRTLGGYVEQPWMPLP